MVNQVMWQLPVRPQALNPSPGMIRVRPDLQQLLTLKTETTDLSWEPEEATEGSHRH